MKITTYSSGVVHAHDDLFSHLDAALPQLEENCVVAITSKVVALCEGAVVAKDAVESKEALVHSQAEYYIPAQHSQYDLTLTVKDHILAVNAGIDESNVDNAYVLLPQDPFHSACEIWKYLRKKHQVTNLGVLITDSKTIPLKWGTVGTALAHCGFDAVVSKIGEPDLFGRLLHMTKVNVAEGLAAASVVEMGEAAEATPFAVLEDIAQIRFASAAPTPAEIAELSIALPDDAYYPVLSSAPWKKNNQ